MNAIREHFGSKSVVGAEIGVWKGYHAEDILLNYQEVTRLYLVDPYKAYAVYHNVSVKGFRNARRRAHARLKSHKIDPERYVFVEDFFKAECIPEKLDFIYIDGNHNYENTIHDISEAEKIVRTGGVIAGHDYHDVGSEKEHLWGVGLAVREKFKGQRLYIDDVDWWIFK